MSQASDDAKAPTPPNVLWLITDQQTAGALGCADNPWLSTPAIDSIAERGIRFERAYCTYPLCTPSRGSMLTGRYPHQIDCNSNSQGKGGRFFWYRDFPREYLLTHNLGRQGYRCVWAGKDMPPEDGSCDVELLCPWGDAGVGDHLVDFIGGEHERPFLAVGAFVNPHNICEWSRQCPLPEGDVGVPPPLDELPPLPANHAVAPDAAEMVHCLQMESSFAFHPRGVTEEEWRQYIWAYYRMIEKVDEQVGRLLAALDEAGLTDNTLVIFTGDHGDGCASHTWNQKMALYEEVIRIPLVMAGPGIVGDVVDREHLVSNGLDLFPTICDVAGVPIPGHVEGRSLLPLCRGAAPGSWRDELVIETAFSRERGGDDPARNRGRALLRNGLKYVVYAWGRNREQIIDLNRDPGETHSCADEPGYDSILMEMRERLHAWTQETGDTFAVPGHEMRSPEAGWQELAQIRECANR